jgi:hypothetical protein
MLWILQSLLEMKTSRFEMLNDCTFYLNFFGSHEEGFIAVGYTASVI